LNWSALQFLAWCHDQRGTPRYWIEFLLRLRATGMSIADMQRFATLRAHGPDTVEARLALLREHRRQLGIQINQLETNGQALDMKITHYEKLLEES
jgi:DNA-binding transcriptional MerR regulator